MADIKANLDGEILIPLIEKRALLWDRTLDTYKDKKLRHKAWHEVCATINPDFEDMEDTEKREYAKIVVQKWNQLRDSWIRSLNTTKNARKSGALYVKKYRFHSQLLFLKKVIEIDGNTSNDDSGEEVNQEDGQEDSNQNEEREKEVEIEITQIIPRQSVKRFKSNEPKRISRNIAHSQMIYQNAQNDRHMSFFKSLLPSLALLDDDQILEFQMGVLSTIQDIRNRRNEIFIEPSTSFSFPHQVFTPDFRGQSSPSTARSPSPSDFYQPSADDESNDCKMFTSGKRH